MSHCDSRERERVILKNSEQAFRYSKSVLTTTTIWAVVVAQLVERSLPTPEIRGSNPVIGKLLYQTFNCLSTVSCIEKTKLKKKEAGNGPFLKEKKTCHRQC